MSERADDIEVRRALKLLEALIKAHGRTKKALDQKLRKGPGYISQVLTGRLELKYRHILEILGALELDPGLFGSATQSSQLRELRVRQFAELLRGAIGARP